MTQLQAQGPTTADYATLNNVRRGVWLHRLGQLVITALVLAAYYRAFTYDGPYPATSTPILLGLAVAVTLVAFKAFASDREIFKRILLGIAYVAGLIGIMALGKLTFGDGVPFGQIYLGATAVIAAVYWLVRYELGGNDPIA